MEEALEKFQKYAARERQRKIRRREGADDVVDELDSPVLSSASDSSEAWQSHIEMEDPQGVNDADQDSLSDEEQEAKAGE